MHYVMLAAALLTASAGVAYAEQPTSSPVSGRQITVCSADAGATWVRACTGRTTASVQPASDAARQVVVCSADTRNALAHQFGATTFVTAKELAKAEASGESWSMPRCMTSAEAQKFAKGQPEEAALGRALDLASL